MAPAILDHHFKKAPAVLGSHHTADFNMVGIVFLRCTRLAAGEGIAVAMKFGFDLHDARCLFSGEMIRGCPFEHLTMQRGTFCDYP